MNRINVLVYPDRTGKSGAGTEYHFNLVEIIQSPRCPNVNFRHFPNGNELAPGNYSCAVEFSSGQDGKLHPRFNDFKKDLV